jgi:tetratricopeptide (TPR) repeat protein
MSNKWEILKDKGNEEFRKQNFSSAISLYSESISKNKYLILQELDPNQDSSWANRGLCYLQVKKYSQAKSDLTKAITLNYKNIKALKRLAFVHLTLGELAEAEMYLKRCTEVEPKEDSHREDVKIVKDLITTRDDLNKAKFVYDYKTSETLAAKLLQKCSEDSKLKLIYLECLLQNCKPAQALTFIKSKVEDEELKKEEFHYLQCQAYYHDGKL